MNQLDAARKGVITSEMRQVSKTEGVSPEFVRRGIASGTIVIPKNIRHKLKIVCGIGHGLTTKINANIGTSKGSSDIRTELNKMDAAIDLGADTIMDLSTGTKIAKTRKAIMSRSRVPVGTVPIYEIIINGLKKYGAIKDITVDDMFSVLESQAKDGVDFFTIHAGVLMDTVQTLKKRPRILDIVSRGGAFLAQWMIENNKENPFYTNYDRVLDIAKRFDVTISLGDGLRPGSIADATDGPQLMELSTLGELRKISVKRGVQIIIEGPGHVPLNQVETNVLLQKELCGGAPFYVLGPLVTDIAPGYDHITAAIGGALAAGKGADYLCYVTPAEHLRLPTIDDVKEGVIASKIAAHAGDIAKGLRGSMDRDIAISRARRARNWSEQFRLAIDNVKPKRYRLSSHPDIKDACTMCGEYCSIKVAEKCLGRK